MTSTMWNGGGKRVLTAVIALAIVSNLYLIFRVDLSPLEINPLFVKTPHQENKRTHQENNDNKGQLQEDGNDAPHKIAGLSCSKFGGPSDEIAAEMVYWRHIPTDALYKSPFKHVGLKNKYLTFEPDEGGWNNIRMAMETVVVLAYAMGRTLVLPPEQEIYLLEDEKHKKEFGFNDFFHFESLAKEHVGGVDLISTKDFLEQQVMTGNIPSATTGRPSFPPRNETMWNDATRWDGPKRINDLHNFLRAFALSPLWDGDECVAAFPSNPGREAMERLDKMGQEFFGDKSSLSMDDNNQYTLTPVNASAKVRLREIIAERKRLCIYNETMQHAPVVHFPGDEDSGVRMLIHFYAFVFFEDWRHDVWTKRFVRDHLRYTDEIQCAAARVVHAVRKKAQEHGSEDGRFDTFHIRRGDFQYEETRIKAIQIYKNVENKLQEGGTVFIATDERKKRFFAPFREHYNVYFLDDFKDELAGVNTNYYGMIDQLVASRGYTFVGCYFSTFTSYINRLRGYASNRKDGTMRSFYYAPKDMKYAMTRYQPITDNGFFTREFPIAWRDIDQGIDELAAEVNQ